MKQLKFLKTIALEGKPIWYKDCCYEIISESDKIYKLFSEDLQLRGIDKILENDFFILINPEK